MLFRSFFSDGDVDERVDLETMRVYDRYLLTRTTATGRDPAVDVLDVPVTIPRGKDGSFGLKVGWTTAGRVIVTGFVENGPAAACVNLSLGDEIIRVGDVIVSHSASFDEVKEMLKNTPGDSLRLVVRPAAASAFDLALDLA